MRNGDEYGQNPQIRRGVVVDRDPKKLKVKVQFEDEDDVVTQWIDVPVRSSTGVSVYQMPGDGDEVWCAMDAKAEGGCVIGSRYNGKDLPPFAGNDDIGVTFPGGSIHINSASGAITINSAGAVDITAASGHLK